MNTLILTLSLLSAAPAPLCDISPALRAKMLNYQPAPPIPIPPPELPITISDTPLVPTPGGHWERYGCETGQCQLRWVPDQPKQEPAPPAAPPTVGPACPNGNCGGATSVGGGWRWRRR